MMGIAFGTAIGSVAGGIASVAVMTAICYLYGKRRMEVAISPIVLKLERPVNPP